MLCFVGLRQESNVKALFRHNGVPVRKPFARIWAAHLTARSRGLTVYCLPHPSGALFVKSRAELAATIASRLANGGA